MKLSEHHKQVNKNTEAETYANKVRRKNKIEIILAQGRVRRGSVNAFPVAVNIFRFRLFASISAAHQWRMGSSNWKRWIAAMNGKRDWVHENHRNKNNHLDTAHREGVCIRSSGRSCVCVGECGSNFKIMAGERRLYVRHSLRPPSKHCHYHAAHIVFCGTCSREGNLYICVRPRSSFPADTCDALRVQLVGAPLRLFFLSQPFRRQAYSWRDKIGFSRFTPLIRVLFRNTIRRHTKKVGANRRTRKPKKRLERALCGRRKRPKCPRRTRRHNPRMNGIQEVYYYIFNFISLLSQ